MRIVIAWDIFEHNQKVARYIEAQDRHTDEDVGNMHPRRNE